MAIVELSAIAGALGLLGAHVWSAIVAAYRQTPRQAPVAPSLSTKIAIIRPLRGTDALTAECLRSTFLVDHRDVEIIFCVASAADPVVSLVRELMEENPRANARLLIGTERISNNPKLNNLIKGYDAARSDWIAIVDSNVALPTDAVARLFDCVEPGVGLVSSPPVGIRAAGWAAHVECAILNSYQARWQSVADFVGLGFAQGKVMMFHRSTLDSAGGLERLGEEAAEDAAATKLVRAQGMSVKLVDRFFPQPIGRRHLKDVYQRQARWASLRRATFPLCFAAEVLSFPWLTIILAAIAADDAAVQAAAVGVTLSVWYGVEAICGWVAGWPERTIHRIFRDALMPIAWMRGWLYSDFVWHGHAMRADKTATVTRA